MDYKDSGVNIEEGYNAVGKYKSHAKRTQIPGILNGLGSFAGMFEVPAGMKNPVMVSGTDGVGTKLDVAFAMKKYDTVGIDCVAMSVNDILCTGARPLYFLDYIACGSLDSNISADLVKGVADGCLDSNCALLGGETAEMPGFYDAGKYDIAGFGVGIAEKQDIISGADISAGDVLIGLSSTGVHSNGFSLVRKLVSDFDTSFNGSTIGKTLLEPTRIYVRPVLKILDTYRSDVHGMAHITGGGFYENIPRMFPLANEKCYKNGGLGLTAHIKNGSWPIHPIFDELVRRGANKERMFNTYNMGIGFVLSVSSSKADEILLAFNSFKSDMQAYKIGYVENATAPIQKQEDAVIFE